MTCVQILLEICQILFYWINCSRQAQSSNGIWTLSLCSEAEKPLWVPVQCVSEQGSQCPDAIQSPQCPIKNMFVWGLLQPRSRAEGVVARVVYPESPETPTRPEYNRVEYIQSEQAHFQPPLPKTSKTDFLKQWPCQTNYKLSINHSGTFYYFSVLLFFFVFLCYWTESQAVNFAVAFLLYWQQDFIDFFKDRRGERSLMVSGVEVKVQKYLFT